MRKERYTENEIEEICQNVNQQNNHILKKYILRMKLKINPDKDSLWYGGRFEFTISVPEGYNFEVSYDLF